MDVAHDFGHGESVVVKTSAAADAVLAIIEPELKQLAFDRDRYKAAHESTQRGLVRMEVQRDEARTEAEAIRVALREVGEDAVPPNITTLAAVQWLIGEHATLASQTEELGAEASVLATERDVLAWLHAEAMWHATHHRAQAETQGLSHALLLRGYRGFANQVDAMARKIRELDAELAEFRAETDARAEAFDDVPHGACTDPPALCCADAGCPEHGQDGVYYEDDEELPAEFHALVRESDEELRVRMANDPQLNELRAILRGDDQEGGK